MEHSDFQAARNASRRCNVDILISAGFVKLGNSSLYCKDDKLYILSPGIGKGKHGKYWFDIRLANLQKIQSVSGASGWLLLRIVPNSFSLFSIARIQEYMKAKTQDDRAHSGKVWGFYCDLDEKNRRIEIFSKNQESASFNTILLDRAGAEAALAEILS